MIISLVTVATNPLTSNYQTFYACVNSWAEIVDEIIVVDGGTNDNSFNSSFISTNAKRKLKVIYNENTSWKYHSGFSSNQINRMWLEGIKSAKGSWTFVIGADYILRPTTKDKLISELKVHNDKSWVRYRRETIFPFTGDVRNDTRTNHILNLGWVDKNIGHRNVYGLKLDNQIIYDYPILPKLVFNEKLNANSPVLSTFLGDLMCNGGDIVISSIQIVNVGHFFYDFNQELEQRVKFQEYFISRATGVAKLNKINAKITFGKIFGELKKSDLLKCDYPKEMLEIIDHFYKIGMVGGLKRKDSYLKSRRYACKMHLIRISRFLKTRGLRLQGFKGTNFFTDKREIHQAESSSPIILDDLWKQQNFYIGGG